MAQEMSIKRVLLSDVAKLAGLSGNDSNLLIVFYV
ncbi:hypothetical protein ACP6PF_11655, partial [Klebsiella pneumoniae]